MFLLTFYEIATPLHINEVYLINYMERRFWHNFDAFEDTSQKENSARYSTIYHYNFMPGFRSIMSIAACESNAITVPIIIAGSVKISDWPIREAVRRWRIIGNWDPTQRVNHLIHCTLCITERVGNNEGWYE